MFDVVVSVLANPTTQDPGGEPSQFNGKKCVVVIAASATPIEGA
jgi:hypothetical protein